jgi:hypothetical protein
MLGPQNHARHKQKDSSADLPNVREGRLGNARLGAYSWCAWFARLCRCGRTEHTTPIRAGPLDIRNLDLRAQIVSRGAVHIAGNAESTIVPPDVRLPLSLSLSFPCRRLLSPPGPSFLAVLAARKTLDHCSWLSSRSQPDLSK